MELELAIRQGRAHVAFERAARLHLHIHARLEEMECPAPRALGPVKRQVRISHQLVWIGAVGGSDRDADAGADNHLMARDVVGLTDCRDSPRCHCRGLRGLLDRGLHDGELVASHACHRVRIPHHGAQASRHGLQQLVADRMSERIVDVLEQVEVQQMCGNGFPARQGMLQPFVEQGAVGQVRQPVVKGHVRYFGLVASLLGDVLMRCDPPTVRHGLVHDGDHASIGKGLDLG